MRRRALLAASQTGGGGEFYCRCLQYHPRTGAVLLDKTYTFVLDSKKTWLECDGQYDITESVSIEIAMLPGNIQALSIYYNRMNFSPTININVSDYPTFGETYTFEYY